MLLWPGSWNVQEYGYGHSNQPADAGLQPKREVNVCCKPLRPGGCNFTKADHSDTHMAPGPGTVTGKNFKNYTFRKMITICDSHLWKVSANHCHCDTLVAAQRREPETRWTIPSTEVHRWRQIVWRLRFQNKLAAKLGLQFWSRTKTSITLCYFLFPF